ncbi:hypothetical protein GCM10011391_13250 [Pullulanibacillus camelliae]|uniref:Fur-regulated basic protein FbpA n=1 Tax=Pullulanibacillus camelliae TaxID=1707096 RepID=A0A8J2VP31_9BACL|nr:Fur-regulated basic protein FbpA [Pullulanibacillus camelliae]GGE35831.1 hypothetical protein GCM10011391_13250 [Pullulanibacillus camelliae]
MQLQESMESKKEELVNKLISFNVFKIKQKQLFELSLEQLEHAYDKIVGAAHPHSGVGAIQWTNKTKRRRQARRHPIRSHD